MTKRKWLLVFLFVVSYVLIRTVLIEVVGYELTNLTLYLGLLITVLYIIILFYYRRRQTSQSHVLLITDSYRTEAISILVGMLLFLGGIGIVFEDLLLRQRIDIFEIVRAILYATAGGMWIIQGRAKTVFTEKGVNFWIFFIKWCDICAYRWQNNRLELQTYGLLSPHYIDIEAGQVAKARALLQRKMSKASLQEVDNQ